MTKVAMISLYPLSDQSPHTGRNLFGLAYAFKRLGMHVELFSMSDRMRKSTARGFMQHEVVSSRPLGNEFTTARYIDLLALVLFGFRPSVEKMNDCPEMLLELNKYEPDLVVSTDTILARLMAEYATLYKKPSAKVMCQSDSYKGISHEIDDNINWLEMNHANPLQIILIKRLLRERYIKYHRSLYGLQVQLSDAFLTPGEEHADEIRAGFPGSEDKVFSLYLEWRAISRGRRRPQLREKIGTILFIGSYTHIPNAIMIKHITDVIAPEMPDKTFIVFGFGCPNKRLKNIIFIDGARRSSGPFLKKADLCIVPLTVYNAGIRTKIMDYAYAGKIVMGTNESFVGFKAKNNLNAVIEDDIRKYPERIFDLEKNYKLRYKIQKNSHTLLNGYLERDTMKELKMILKSIGIRCA